MTSTALYVCGQLSSVSKYAVIKHLERLGYIMEANVLAEHCITESASKKDAAEVLRRCSAKRLLGHDANAELAWALRPKSTSADAAYRPHPSSRSVRTSARFPVFVYNLPKGLRWQELKDFGRLAGGYVEFCDINTVKRDRGFIEYLSPEEAAEAVRELNGKTLKNTTVEVCPHLAARNHVHFPSSISTRSSRPDRRAQCRRGDGADRGRSRSPNRRTSRDAARGLSLSLDRQTSHNETVASAAVIFASSTRRLFVACTSRSPSPTLRTVSVYSDSPEIQRKPRVYTWLRSKSSQENIMFPSPSGMSPERTNGYAVDRARALQILETASGPNAITVPGRDADSVASGVATQSDDNVCQSLHPRRHEPKDLGWPRYDTPRPLPPMLVSSVYRKSRSHAYNCSDRDTPALSRRDQMSGGIKRAWECMHRDSYTNYVHICDEL